MTDLSDRDDDARAFTLVPEYDFPDMSAFMATGGAAWDLAKSRRKAAHWWGRDFVTAASADVSAVLGSFDVTAGRSNATEIDVWMRDWATANEKRSRRAPDLFVAVVDGPGMAESHGFAQGACVRLPVRSVELCIRIATAVPAFSALLAALPGWSAPQRREIESGFRGALAAFLDPRATIPQAPDPLWDLDGNGRIFMIRSVRSAVRWMIAHELAHRVSDARGLRDAARAYRAVVPGSFPTTAAHQAEMACDFLAADFVGHTPPGDADLAGEIIGSLLASLAVAWDGWFEDGSAPSETHPDPDLRFRALVELWMHRVRGAGMSPSGFDVLMPAEFALLSTFHDFSLATPGHLVAVRDGHEARWRAAGAGDEDGARVFVFRDGRISRVVAVG